MRITSVGRFSSIQAAVRQGSHRAKTVLKAGDVLVFDLSDPLPSLAVVAIDTAALVDIKAARTAGCQVIVTLSLVEHPLYDEFSGSVKHFNAAEFQVAHVDQNIRSDDDVVGIGELARSVPLAAETQDWRAKIWQQGCRLGGLCRQGDSCWTWPGGWRGCRGW